MILSWFKKFIDLFNSSKNNVRILSDHKHKAKVSHICDTCLKTIVVGDYYRHISTTSSKIGFKSFKYHLSCVKR